MTTHPLNTRSKPHDNQVCDCGQPAAGWFNGWECARCRRLRLEWGKVMEVETRDVKPRKGAGR